MGEKKKKLYLFPYGQDKCHIAYSFWIMYIFTQLQHYWDHLLLSSFYSVTLQNPKSPSRAPSKRARGALLQEAGALPRNFPGYPSLFLLRCDYSSN